MKGLFLDDERMPSDVKWVVYENNIEWTIVRNMKQFVNAVENSLATGGFDVYSFDHDLQDFDAKREYTGYDCLKWLCAHCDVSEKLVYFHTQNPIGKKNMLGYYLNYVDFIQGE